MATHEHIAAATADLRAEQIDALKQLFPEAVTEGKIDFDLLKTILGDAIDNRPERYSFSWAGKRAAIRAAQTPSAMTLIPAPDESVNFDTTDNLFIEGDNLEALKLLHRPYFGRVKMIYIDPPYNTGNDFVYPDNYADPVDNYLALTGQRGENGFARTSNSETGGRYHSNWLSMMYPRLTLARSLLCNDGVIFVSIDDHEVADLRLLMDTIFGPENFITTVIWQKVYSPKNSARHFSEDHDYIVVYARNAEIWRPELLPRTEEANARYTNPDNDPRGPWKPSDLTARNYYSLGEYEVTGPSGKTFRPGVGRYWIVSKERFIEMDRDSRLWWGESGGSMPQQKRFLSEVKKGIVPQTLWTYQEVGHTQDAKKELIEFVRFERTDNVLDTVKPTQLIQRMLQICTTATQHNIVMDFFAGSATTAHAVLKQNREDGGNRRFIMVQFPEPLPEPETRLKTISDIAKVRIETAIARMNAEDASKLDLSTRETPEDLGFRVFKLTPSNLHQWQAPDGDDTQAYIHQLELMADTVRTDSTPTNVIWEAALREGYSLTATVDRVLSGDTTVYRVADPDKGQSFYICLDTTLRLDALRPLRLTPDDLFICRDSALDDTAAANLALQCRLKTL